MSRASGPDLKKYMDKALTIKMNGNRRVSGVLRGYDQFLNLVLEDATEDGSDGAKTESVEKANQSGGNSSDENTDDDENENENKLEWKRAKVVLETTGERILVRVSESVERGGSNERERECV